MALLLALRLDDAVYSVKVQSESAGMARIAFAFLERGKARCYPRSHKFHLGQDIEKKYLVEDRFGYVESKERNEPVMCAKLPNGAG
jgi:hypothetical protein